MTNNENPIETLKTKLFLKYRRFSYEDLARRIYEQTSVKTTRFQIYGVFKGRMTSSRIRTALAALVGEPPETFWAEKSARKRKSKRGDRIPSTESPSTE